MQVRTFGEKRFYALQQRFDHSFIRISAQEQRVADPGARSRRYLPNGQCPGMLCRQLQRHIGKQKTPAPWISQIGVQRQHAAGGKERLFGSI